jgi:hypothetical protein
VSSFPGGLVQPGQEAPAVAEAAAVVLDVRRLAAPGPQAPDSRVFLARSRTVFPFGKWGLPRPPAPGGGIPRTRSTEVTMSRAVRTLCILLVFAACATVVRGETLDDKLKRKVTVSVIEANTTLKDALDFLSDRYKITFQIDEARFKNAGIQEAGRLPVMLDEQKDVPLGTVLKTLLKSANATYQVKKNQVVVVPAM